MSENEITRRDFLKRSSKAGIAVVAAGSTGFWLRSRSIRPEDEAAANLLANFLVEVKTPIPDMVVARGGSPEELTTAVIKALGGMENFISKDDIVALKPNVSWNRAPMHAANTNPELVKCVVEHCFNAGASKVMVMDNSCNDARMCFNRSGIKNAAESAGAEVILPEKRKFKIVNMAGFVLTNWPVFMPILEADKVINLPIVKHHNLCRATMGMKNWYGMIDGRRNQLHQKIDLSIADLATFFRPTLTILDANRVLMKNGPVGGNVNDVKEFQTVIAGTDPVAIDAFGATILGANVNDIEYIQIAHNRGIGNMNLDELKIENINLKV